MEEIYSGNDIKVVVYPNESDVFFITFASWDIKKHPVNPSEFTGFGGDILHRMGYNQINVQTSKNNWYQTKEIIDAIDAILSMTRKAKKVITYGSSMGAYASINFSSMLNADIFIAISPQFSINPCLMHDSDTRWRYEYNNISMDYDYIYSARNLDSSGYIFYDDKGADRHHAESISEKTNGILVPLSYSGHPCGGVINRVYGLKRVLKEIVEDRFDSDRFLSEIMAEIGNTTEYIYRNIGDNNNREVLVSRIKEGKVGAREKAWLMDMLSSSKENKDLGELLIKETSLDEPMKGNFREKFITCRAKLLLSIGRSERAFYETLRLENPKNWIVKKSMVNINKRDRLEKIIESFTISPDVLRDVALFFENKDVLLSYKIMKKARDRRPKGEFISKKVREYEIRINNGEGA